MQAQPVGLYLGQDGDQLHASGCQREGMPRKDMSHHLNSIPTPQWQEKP